MIELIDFRHLTQLQLVEIINAATVHLDRDQYSHTHLYMNGQNVELEMWWSADK